MGRASRAKRAAREAKGAAGDPVAQVLDLVQRVGWKFVDVQEQPDELHVHLLHYDQIDMGPILIKIPRADWEHSPQRGALEELIAQRPASACPECGHYHPPGTPHGH